MFDFKRLVLFFTIHLMVFMVPSFSEEIHNFARRGEQEKVKALIEEHPEFLNLKDQQGRTPLICAVLTLPYGYTINQGNRDVVKYLIEKGAGLPDKDAANEILHPAAYCGFKELVAALVARGENIRTFNKNGGTLLHSAAAGGLENLVEQLIKRGLKLNQKNRYGLAPIHLTAISGFQEIIDILIQAGADINIKSFEGKSPLHYALEHGHQKVASLLVTRGANQDPPQFPVLKGKYMGQKVPGKKPELFAPGIISTIFVDHSSLSFSPDGKQVVWSPVIKNCGIVYLSRVEKGCWTLPQKAPFSGNFVDCMPVFTQNSQLVFYSDRPMNPGEKRKDGLWISEKNGHTWAKTHPLASNIDLGQVNSQPAISSNKNLYFSTLLKGGKGTLDIYCSKYINGQYTKPKNLGEPINTKNIDYSPLIAPDESYMIFSSDRPGGYGSLDLYISFRQKNGSWCNPMNLGDQINTKYYEWFNTFSADGKYFFFGSSRNGNFDIYWVDARIIEDLIPEELEQ